MSHTALYDYSAGNSEELSVKAGDRLESVEDSQPDSNWTKVRDGNGNCGLVPTSYIELSYQNSGYAQEILRAGLSASAGAVNHPGASSAGPAVGRRYVLFEYTANDNQEISVQEGDIVEVLEDVDGWLMVRNAQGSQGFVPASYVGQPVSDAENIVPAPEAPAINVADRWPQASAAITSHSAPPPPATSRNATVKALYDYLPGPGSSPEELQLRVGEELAIIFPDDGDGWTEVRRLGGDLREGIVPSSYLETTSNCGDSDDDDDDDGYTAVGGVDEHEFPVPPPEPVAAGSSHVHELWFHGRLSRAASESLLMNQGKQHSFLIRESEATPGDYSVCVNGGSKIKHFKVTKSGEAFVIGERQFNSLSALIDFYKTHAIFTTSYAEAIHTSFPLPKAR